MTNPIYRFLQVDELKCAVCGQPVDGFNGYLKLDLHPQYFFFTLGWFRAFFGDHWVLRFCGRAHYVEFAAGGRLKELAPK